MLDVRAVTAREEWNYTVLGFSGRDLRQSYEWGELRRLQGWRPLRVAAFEGGRCLGSILYAPRGPLIESGAQAAWEALQALVRHAGRIADAIVLPVSPAVAADNADSLSELQEMGFSQLPDFWSLWNTPRMLPHARASLSRVPRVLRSRAAREPSREPV